MIEQFLQFIDSKNSKLKKKKLIKRIFDIQLSIKHQKINDLKIKLPPQISHQLILRIKNKILNKEALFNPSRKLLKNLKSKKCQFCQFYTSTLKPEKRFKGKYWITADNLFPYDKYHGLLIFKQHRFTKISPQIFHELFYIVNRWFFYNRKKNHKLKFLFLGINYLFPAGASIKHPHFHILFSNLPYFFQNQLNRKINNYYRKYRTNFLSDFYKAAFQLNLAFQKNKLKFIVSPTTYKYPEFWIIFRNFNFSVFKYLAKVFDYFVKKNISFNFYIYFPHGKHSKNYIAFFLLRNIQKANLGVMEFYGTPVLSFDPWEFKKELEKIIKK